MHVVQVIHLLFSLGKMIVRAGILYKFDINAQYESCNPKRSHLLILFFPHFQEWIMLRNTEPVHSTNNFVIRSLSGIQHLLRRTIRRIEMPKSLSFTRVENLMAVFSQLDELGRKPLDHHHASSSGPSLPRNLKRETERSDQTWRSIT